jgi:hypothetical protein
MSLCACGAADVMLRSLSTQSSMTILSCVMQLHPTALPLIFPALHDVTLDILARRWDDLDAAMPPRCASTALPEAAIVSPPFAASQASEATAATAGAPIEGASEDSEALFCCGCVAQLRHGCVARRQPGLTHGAFFERLYEQVGSVAAMSCITAAQQRVGESAFRAVVDGMM